MRFLILCLLNVFITFGFSQNLPKEAWKIISVDSQDTNAVNPGYGSASSVIDNNINTFWTAFDTPETPFPHYIVIDLGSTVDIRCLVFYPRQGKYSGRISDYRITTSLDNQHWELIHKGVFKQRYRYDYSPQRLVLGTQCIARFVKFEVVKQMHREDDYVQLAEIDIYGAYKTPFFSPKIHIQKRTITKNDFAQFVDSSFVQCTEIRHWEWHFPGGNPSKSFEQNPKVRYKAYGKYSASLTVTSKEGIKKTVILHNVVNYLPAPEIPRTDWKLSVSEQEVIDGHDVVAKMLDGDPATHWHTAWYSVKKLPHFIRIDLGQEIMIHAIGYLPRQVGSINGVFSSYRVFVSNDSTDIGKEVCHVEESKLYRSFRFIEFPPAKGRYLKIVIDKTFPLGMNFASASEVYVYGEVKKQFDVFWVIIGLFLIALLFLLFRFTSKRKKNDGEPALQVYNELANNETIKIYLFGKFEIINEGNVVEQLFYKIKQVFVLITYHTIEYSGISTNELSRLLWSDLLKENVTSARSSNVKKLRTALESVPDVQIVVTNMVWKLNTTEKVIVDFNVYRKLFNALSNSINSCQYNETEINNFLSVIERGRFLDEFETDWADNIKNIISEEIVDLLKLILERFHSQLSRVMKSRVCDCLFLQDEFNNTALRIKLQLFIDDSNPGLARNFYETFTRRYKLIYKETFPTNFADILQK